MSDDQFCTATASGGFKSPGAFRSPVPPPCLVMGGCEDLKHERGVLAAMQEERANLIKECQAKQAVVNEQYSQIANQMETIKELQGAAERATNEATSPCHLKTEKEVMLGRIANQSSQITALEEVRRKDRSTYEASIQGVKAEKEEWRKKCDRLTAELAGRLSEAATVKELKEERITLSQTIGDYQVSAMAKAKRIQELKEDLDAHRQAYDQAVGLLDLEKSKNQNQAEIIKELEKERDAARVESRNVHSSWKLASDQRDAKEREIRNLLKANAGAGGIPAEMGHLPRDLAWANGRISELAGKLSEAQKAAELAEKRSDRMSEELEGARRATEVRASGLLNALEVERKINSDLKKKLAEKDAFIGKLTPAANDQFDIIQGLKQDLAAAGKRNLRITLEANKAFVELDKAKRDLAEAQEVAERCSEANCTLTVNLMAARESLAALRKSTEKKWSKTEDLIEEFAEYVQEGLNGMTEELGPLMRE